AGAAHKLLRARVREKRRIRCESALSLLCALLLRPGNRSDPRGRPRLSTALRIAKRRSSNETVDLPFLPVLGDLAWRGQRRDALCAPGVHQRRLHVQPGRGRVVYGGIKPRLLHDWRWPQRAAKRRYSEYSWRHL